MEKNHGSHSRVFTEAQEAEITEGIVSDYVAAGNLFTSAVCETIAMRVWKGLGKDPIEF
jgi:hypothetical protein